MPNDPRPELHTLTAEEVRDVGDRAMAETEEERAAESEREAYDNSHFAQDEAFCARMRWAIAAGLEHPPIGVVTTPGTKNPRHIPAEPLPLASSQRAVEHA